MNTVDAPARWPATLDSSLGYLLGRLAVVELALREAIARRLPHDPEPGDRLRGVYLSDAYVQWLLDRPLQPTSADPASPSPSPGLAEHEARLERDADVAEAAGTCLRLRRLSRTFGLDAVDERLLVVALAPALDPRFGQLFGYLNDDVTRRSPSVSLCVELASGTYPSPPPDWRRLAPASRLVRARLVALGDADRPLSGKSVSVPDRVIGYLLGHDEPDEAVLPLVRHVEVLPLVDPALASLDPGDWVFVRQRPGTDAATEAATWLAHRGIDSLVAAWPHGSGGETSDGALELLARECRLTERALVLGPIDDVADGDDRLGLLDRAVDGVASLVLWGRTEIDLRWAERIPGLVDLDVPRPTHRLNAWRALCDGMGVADSDLRHLAERHRLGAAMAARAVRTAAASSSASGRRVDGDALRRGLRALDAGAMQRLSRRVRPSRTVHDLVLPDKTMRDLVDLLAMVQMRDRVGDDWGLARGGRSRGVAALFAGPSGTGKTLAAEVVAGELGVDLYSVDLSTVVDKYVGETEKNLDRVLSAAEGVTGVLLFDEADALFGKRADVRQGQDRYANLEVSYLLARVEDFGGVVILSTNLRSHVDEAFLRRIDSLVEFSVPDTDHRLRLWQTHAARLPHGDDLDLEFVADAFELSGGSIRNSVVTAACLAATSEEPLQMRHIVRGLEREYEKLGRLRVAGDFGPYAHLMEGRP